MLDMNTANKQIIPETHIPHNTKCPVHMTVRPGGAGDDGWLKQSNRGDCQMLDCEFTVIEGKYARRKFWTLLVVEGETDGQKQAADISKSRLRAILESARGVNPTDESEQACAARRVGSFGDFDGLRFVAVVGFEKGKDGYKDKNFLTAAVTPDQKDWTRLDQPNRPNTVQRAMPVKTASKPAASGGKPSWLSKGHQPAAEEIPF